MELWMSDTDWKALDHEIPDGWEKYVVMLAEACSTDNELKLITRFQKVVRLIREQEVVPLRQAIQGALTYDPMVDKYKLKQFFKTNFKTVLEETK
jgi:hypothetical protein